MARKPQIVMSDEAPKEEIELVKLGDLDREMDSKLASLMDQDIGPVVAAPASVTQQVIPSTLVPVSTLYVPPKIEIVAAPPTLSAQTLREMKRGAEAIGRG